MGFNRLPIRPHVSAAPAASLQVKRGSESDSRTSSGHRSPLIAVECEQ
jgi:hypothetical protein